MIQNTSASDRNIGLDALRYLCSFMVVCIHMQYDGKTYLEPLTRFAVPVFFMITGYFYSTVKQRNSECIQIKKTVKLLLYAYFLYFVWNLLRCLLENESFLGYLHTSLSLGDWIGFVCFNKALFSGHLWYLGALIYVLVFVLAIDKYSKREKLYKFIPLLLAVNLILGNYSTIIFGTRLHLWLSRNFMFCGLPFFLLGDVIYKKQNKLHQSRLVLVAVFSVFLTVTENAVLLHIGAAYNTDCFIGTPLLACSLFLFALGNRTVSPGPLWTKAAQLGKSTATVIYIVHPIAIAIIGRAAAVVGRYVPGLDIMWDHIAPLIIFVSCTIFACCFNAFKRVCNRYSRLRNMNSAAQ